MLTAKEKLDSIVSLVNESDIASIRNVISGIVRIINNSNSTIQDLCELIQIDPLLTAKLLKLANSAYYSPPVKLTEINKAIIWIGFDAVKEMALNQKAFEIFDNNESYASFSRSALWEHSVAIALFGKLLYRREFGCPGETAYIAGLLHNIGIIAEDQFLHDDFRMILNSFDTDRKNLNIVEKEILGFDHSELGQKIMESWNLSDDLAMALGFHHQPQHVPKRFAQITYTLFIADYYCQKINIGFSDTQKNSEELFFSCMDSLRIKSQSLELITNEVKNELDRMKDKGLI